MEELEELVLRQKVLSEAVETKPLSSLFELCKL